MTLAYRIVYFFVVRILLPLLNGVNDKVARGYQLRQPQNGKLPWLVPPKSLRPLWIHCASGEFEYALPVIREIKKNNPLQKILVSYFTPTYVERMMAEPLVDFVVPAPWDESGVIKEFIDHHQPAALLFARTDVWFEMSRQCSLHKIPVIVFSMTFQKKINLMLQIFLRWRWQFVDNFWVVSERDATQLKSLLPKAHIEVAGDSRYDQCLYRLSQNKTLPFTIQESTRKLIVAGSTWPEDEAVLAPTIANTALLRWIVVPHETTSTHLSQLEQRLKAQQIDFVRSSHITVWDGTQVLIVDQVGLLAELYRFADMSFVGGSFRKQVHSVMESLACGCLTFVGPFYKNNREAIEFSSEFSSEFSPEFSSENTQMAAVQVVNNSQELTRGIEHFATYWTASHRNELKERFLQKTGASVKIAGKI